MNEKLDVKKWLSECVFLESGNVGYVTYGCDALWFRIIFFSSVLAQGYKNKRFDEQYIRWKVIQYRGIRSQMVLFEYMPFY